MNILLIAKMGAAVVALFIAYWIGLNDGKNSEELKNARVTISALDTALQEQQAKQKSDALALSNLRIAESRSRDELDWLASNCPKLSEKQRPIPIDSVIDVSATEQKLERLQQDYLELLNSVKKTTNEGK